MSGDDRERWNDRYRNNDVPLRGPSPFLVSLDRLLPRVGRALDVAGGSGRNSIWLARRGLDVALVDVSERGNSPGEGSRGPGRLFEQESPTRLRVSLKVGAGDEMMPNLLRVIAPYWYEGTWVFDDESVDLFREPFVAGIPTMIDEMVAEIPNARDGFRLTFSDRPFPGSQVELTWLREELDGNWYRSSVSQEEGWLCPALFSYFDQAPRLIYARADAKSGDS